MRDWPNEELHPFSWPMQAPSVAVHTEMETEPCCEEHKDSAEEATKPDIRQATCESADSDAPTQMPCGSAEEGNDLFVGKQAETETREVEGDCTEKKTPCEPQREGGVVACMELRKLKKTNSWKMVRFQDPSEDDDVSDRDTSAESLFPEYALKEWTSSTFEELFSAEDWQDITGEEMSCRYSGQHPALHRIFKIYIPILMATICWLVKASFRMCLLASILTPVASSTSFWGFFLWWFRGPTPEEEGAEV